MKAPKFTWIVPIENCRVQDIHVGFSMKFKGFCVQNTQPSNPDGVRDLVFQAKLPHSLENDQQY